MINLSKRALHDTRRFFRRIGLELRWLFKMGGALQRQHPWHLSLYAGLFLLSQTALLTALLLPWNILTAISLGVQTSVAVDLGRVSALMIVTLMCFGAHIGFELIAAKICRIGANSVLARHQKLGMTRARHEQAIRYYAQVLRIFAMLLYIALAAVIVGIFYPLVLFLGLAYGLVSLPIIAIWPPAPAGSTQSELKSKLWWCAGFLFMVGAVIIDGMAQGTPPFHLVFLALLLGRQCLVYAMLTLALLHRLADRRERIEALFLQDQPFVIRPDFEGSLTELLAPERREVWLPNIIAHFGLSADTQLEDIKWSEQGRLAYLRLKGPDSNTPAILKIFHKSLEGRMQKEVELLHEAEPHWPSPTYLGMERINGFIIVGLAPKARWKWFDEQITRSQSLTLREDLISCAVSAELTLRHKRSHPHMHQRLQTVDWQMVKDMIAPELVAAECARLSNLWHSVCDWLSHQPLQITLPKLLLRRMIKNDRGQLALCNWTDWQLEPIGYDWPYQQRPVADLRNCISRASVYRPELAKIQVDDVLLVARLADFEVHYQKRDFARLVRLIPPLLDAIDRQIVHPSGEADKENSMRGGSLVPLSAQLTCFKQ